jgi:glycosyltransferase involved in cell wall biosynthesis
MENDQPPIPISVLMAVFNEEEENLRASIESILNQTEEDFEFVIVNDGSTDKKCLAILEEYAQKDNRILLIHLEREAGNAENTGLTRALNFGLSHCQGIYVARMDSDDISEKNRFEIQRTFMETHPDVALCSSWCCIINEKGAIIGKKKTYAEYQEIKKQILTVNSFVHSTWFFRKSIVESLGNYHEDMLKAQDYDLLLRIIPRFPVAIIPEYLLRYRLTDKNISLSNNKLQEKYALKARLKALREYGYPKRYYVKIIVPFFVHWFLPSSLKKQLMKLLWKI